MKAWHKRRRLIMLDKFGMELPFIPRLIEQHWQKILVELKDMDLITSDIPKILNISLSVYYSDCRKLGITRLKQRFIKQDRVKDAVNCLDLRNLGHSRVRAFRENNIFIG